MTGAEESLSECLRKPAGQGVISGMMHTKRPGRCMSKLHRSFFEIKAFRLLKTSLCIIQQRSVKHLLWVPGAGNTAVNRQGSCSHRSHVKSTRREGTAQWPHCLP